MGIKSKRRSNVIIYEVNSDDSRKAHNKNIKSNVLRDSLSLSRSHSIIKILFRIYIHMRCRIDLSLCRTSSYSIDIDSSIISILIQWAKQNEKEDGIKREETKNHTRASDKTYIQAHNFKTP